MLLGGGELDGVRILGPRTLALMTRNHISGGLDTAQAAAGNYTEVAAPGTGFGLGFSVTLDPVRTGVTGSAGEFAWGGAASTVFWVDPVEEMIVIFMTQFMPSGTFNFRGQLKSIVYGAITD
jgi:CubicO group peptidase (beta-lactamase class C family)